MKVLVVYNASDQRCGFANFGSQLVTALGRAGVEVTAWDGTYSVLHARSERGEPDFFPADIESYDVLQTVWHAATLNHYSGAPWSILRHPLRSWWDGGPSNTYCPFADTMQQRWTVYPRDGYHILWYPVVDWVADRPPEAPTFTVGASSVRGDGVPLIDAICAAHGWATNLPAPDQWLSIDDEVRRLARSSVNVCWYRTPDLWLDRGGAASTLLAAGRPVLINNDRMLAHLYDAEDIYHCDRAETPTGDVVLLEAALVALAAAPVRRLPYETATRLSWTAATRVLLDTWTRTLETRCLP